MASRGRRRSAQPGADAGSVTRTLAAVAPRGPCPQALPGDRNPSWKRRGWRGRRGCAGTGWARARGGRTRPRPGPGAAARASRGPGRDPPRRRPGPLGWALLAEPTGRRGGRRGEEWEEGAGQGKCDVSAGAFLYLLPGSRAPAAAAALRVPAPPLPGVELRASAAQRPVRQHVGDQEAEDGRLRAACPHPAAAPGHRVPSPGAGEQPGAEAPARGGEEEEGERRGGRGQPSRGKSFSAGAPGNLRGPGLPRPGGGLRRARRS